MSSEHGGGHSWREGPSVLLSACLAAFPVSGGTVDVDIKDKVPLPPGAHSWLGRDQQSAGLPCVPGAG